MIPRVRRQVDAPPPVRMTSAVIDPGNEVYPVPSIRRPDPDETYRVFTVPAALLEQYEDAAAAVDRLERALLEAAGFVEDNDGDWIRP